METTNVLQKWMDKQILVYPYNGTLPRDEKEWTTNTSKNMDKSQTNYAE